MKAGIEMHARPVEAETDWVTRKLQIAKGNTRQRRCRKWRRWRRLWCNYEYRAKAWLWEQS